MADLLLNISHMLIVIVVIEIVHNFGDDILNYIQWLIK